ncbi:MAG TPA: hypothetical protein VFZ65_00685 [Planctomycetota bacterium]|nr:hypothetical protein [Planctomycetota bacterium]
MAPSSSPGPLAAPDDALLARCLTHVLHVGLEHLPPAEPMPSDDGPHVEPRTLLAEPTPRTRARDNEAAPRPQLDAFNRHTWSMSSTDLCNIDDPIERETLHFVQDLVAADQRRVRREVAMPLLQTRYADPDRGPLLTSEVSLVEAQDQWVDEHGQELLQSSLRHLVRRLPLAQQLQVDFEDFRSENVPLSEPYRQTHDEGRRLGRLSLRVHASDLHDPIEVAYIRSGIRIATSQETGKLSIDWALSPTLKIELRARTEYATNEQHVRADLAYRPSPTTSLHLAAGDDMDFLSTSSIYSVFESPMDGAPGLVLYAVHIF